MPPPATHADLAAPAPPCPRRRLPNGGSLIGLSSIPPLAWCAMNLPTRYDAVSAIFGQESRTPPWRRESKVTRKPRCSAAPFGGCGYSPPAAADVDHEQADGYAQDQGIELRGIGRRPASHPSSSRSDGTTDPGWSSARIRRCGTRPGRALDPFPQRLRDDHRPAGDPGGCGGRGGLFDRPWPSSQPGAS